MDVYPASPDPDNLQALWETMSAETGDLIERSRNYARWTIPAVCPEENTEGQEQIKAEVTIGPRLVNHLANKVVDTMFPHGRPFFAITPTPEAKQELLDELGKNNEAEFSEQLREGTAQAEQAALRKLRLGVYRPQAVEAVKHLIITGNCVLRRLENGRRLVYGVKDFRLRRNADGECYHSVLKDAKIFGRLPAEYQEALQAAGNHQYKDTDRVDLYTEYRKDSDTGRWMRRQALNDVFVGSAQYFNDVDLPVLPLVWNLAKGENYARGLVEDHSTGFHQIDVLSAAVLDMAGILADVKFLVEPSSLIDVVEFNNSPRGSYHSGSKDDVSATDFGRRLEIGTVAELISKLERELSQAFLLSSSGVRDAERVTAEEIRFIAMELEGAFGGLYSRLALEWQQREAEYAVSQIDMDLLGTSQDLEVVITTGLENLSREGQLDNLRRALADLQLIESIPEDLRKVFDPLKLASFVFTNHAVPYREFLFTAAQVQQNQAAQMEQEQQLLNMQAGAKVQEAVGKQAAQET